MFGSNILETAIAVVFVFLMMSLLGTALREVVETFLKQRALDQERGIRELLQDPDGQGLAKALYSHPLVFGLFQGEYRGGNKSGDPVRDGFWKRWFGYGGNLPSYVPPLTFAQAILDLERRGGIASPAVRDALEALAHGTGGDVAKLEANVIQWFQDHNERITGWYKRRTQVYLLALGFATAAAMNVDALRVTRTLFMNEQVRKAVVEQAEKLVSDTTATKQLMAAATAAANKAPAQGVTGADPALTGPAGDSARVRYEAAVAASRTQMDNVKKLAEAGLPMGWGADVPPAPWKGGEYAPWLAMLLGWLLTAVAVSLGAPFWFDLLSKFMVVRSTMKPTEREKPEAAKEPAQGALAFTPPQPVSQAGALVQPARPVQPAGAGVGAAEGPPVAAGSFEPHVWADSLGTEGDL